MFLNQAYFSNNLGFKNDLFLIQERAAHSLKKKLSEIKNKSRLNLGCYFFVCIY